MSYLQQYQQKLVTAAQAVQVVKSGDWVEHAFGGVRRQRIRPSFSPKSR